MTRTTLAVAFSLLAHVAVAIVQWTVARRVTFTPSFAIYAFAAYALATVVMLAAYTWIVRSGTDAATKPREWRLLLVAPVALQLGWLLVPPTLSIDPYSYDVYAAQFHAGLNPYLHAASDAGASELGRALAAWGWRPVHGTPPYGPIWLDVMRLLGPVSGNVLLAVGLMKLLGAASLCLTAWLAGRVAPERWRAAATLAVWWNPLLIIESTGEAHNDALMVAATVLALWYLRREAPVRAAVALMIGVLTKWITLLLAPVLLAYAWSQGWIGFTGRPGRRLLETGITIGAVTLLAFWPVWVGLDTFNGLRDLGEPRFVASTVGALADYAIASPPFGLALRIVTTAITLLAVAWASWRAGLAGRTAGSLEPVLGGCAVIVTAYILITAPLFWAWYLMLPIVLLTLAGDLPLALVLTAAGRAVAPIDMIRLRTTGISWDEQVWITTVVALWLPLAFIAVRWLLRALGYAGTDAHATGGLRRARRARPAAGHAAASRVPADLGDGGTGVDGLSRAEVRRPGTSRVG